MKLNSQRIGDTSLEQCSCKEAFGVLNQEDAACEAQVGEVEEQGERVGSQETDFFGTLPEVDLTEVEGRGSTTLEPHGILLQLLAQVLRLGEHCPVLERVRILNQCLYDFLAIHALLLEVVNVFGSHLLRRVGVHHVAIVLQLFLSSCSIIFFWRVVVEIKTSEKLVGHLALRLFNLFEGSTLPINYTEHCLERLPNHHSQVDGALAGVSDFARLGVDDSVEARVVDKHEKISFFNQIH